METTMARIVLPQDGQLLIPITPVTHMALECVQTVLIAADVEPQLLEPREAHFRQVIIGTCMALERFENDKLYLLSQLAGVRRPSNLWDIVEKIIKADNDRGQPANYCPRYDNPMGPEGCRHMFCPSHN